jgi:hypothetical protein
LQDWINRDLRLLMQSDDTVIMTRYPVDRDRWTASMLRLGLTSELTPGRRFLMKHLMPNGSSLMVGGRVVQNTISPEYPHVGRSALALNRLGLAARLQSGIHPIVAQETWRVLTMIPWVIETLRDLNYKPTADTSQFARNILRYYAKDISVAIERLANSKQFSITQLERDAPYSASAAATLALMQQMNASAVDELSAVSQAFKTASANVQDSAASKTPLARGRASAALAAYVLSVHDRIEDNASMIDHLETAAHVYRRTA